MKALDLESVKADLHQYLREETTLLSPEFIKVVADVSKFTFAIVRDGFGIALAGFAAPGSVNSDRPFIEVADAIVEHHIRFVPAPEREIVRKSLSEAYIHAAGPRYILKPLSNTRLVSSLNRSGPAKFVTLLFSLHLFNVISMRIQDQLRLRMPNVKSFELYMVNVEAICRDTVDAAAAPMNGQPVEPDECWAEAVTRSIEMQLLRSAVRPIAASADPQ